MAVETNETEIDGTRVLCTMHKARPGAKLAAKLLRLASPLIGMFKASKLEDVKKMDLGDLAPLVGRMFATISDEQLDELLVDLLSRTMIVKLDEAGKPRQYDLSKPAQIDDAFTGELGLMMLVAKNAIEVNFGRFFAGSALKSATLDEVKTAAPAP